MHDWSEEGFDWKGLDRAISMIADFCRRWGRIGAHAKEKYGTARVYVSFWDGTLHGLIYPGCAYSQFPQWLWVFDLTWIRRFTRLTKIHRIVHWWQKRVYGWAYLRALKRFPRLHLEILVCADHPELIGIKLNPETQSLE